jgi:uncharacterized protein (UPF0276 family)
VPRQLGTTDTAASPGRSPIPAQAGIGLRFSHHRAVLETHPEVAWLEAHTENYLSGDASTRCLEAIRRDYPLSLHGVGLSLGSALALDAAHLNRIAECVARLEPGLVSEHLSWSAVDGLFLGDLLPLPLTEEALQVVSRHVEQLQERLGRPVLIENPSSYLRYRHSTIPEWEFLVCLAERTGCKILCDVNNIYVSCCNHGWDPLEYLAALPPARIGEIHLAGHSKRELSGGRSILIDDHGSAVCDAVWQLYDAACARFGAVPTLIEWDTNIPALPVLLEQAALATQHMKRSAARPAAGTHRAVA